VELEMTSNRIVLFIIPFNIKLKTLTDGVTFVNYSKQNDLTVPLSGLHFWLRHFATSWRVTGSRLDEVNEFVQFT
jgi:hypothetical protein